MSHTVTVSPESSSNSPGAVLKRCREFHGLSLEEASETTKIGISYLKALEEDQIREFANLTYLKGFLRIYANYLGLNPDDMARMYDKLNGAKDEANDPAGTFPATKRPVNYMVTFQKLVLPAFLFLLILITATFFKSPPPPPLRPPQPVIAPVAALPVAPVMPVRSSAKIKVVKPATEKPLPESKAVDSEPDDKSLQPDPPLQPPNMDDAPKSFILKIRATQNGVLTATVDGSFSQNYDLTVGDIIEWKAENSVKLDVSNAGGIDYEMNGKPYKKLGPTGKSVYVEFDAAGIKR